MVTDPLNGLPAERKNLVLITEDDDAIASLLEEFITDLGCAVLTAKDGHQALELSRSAKPDLILLDHLIPGLNGLEVYQALKSEPDTRSIPVLFVTAALAPAEFEQFGITEFVVKPFDLDDLLTHIQRLLTSDRGSSTGRPSGESSFAY